MSASTAVKPIDHLNNLNNLNFLRFFAAGMVWYGRSYLAFTAAIILLLAALSWHLVEQPMLRFKPKPALS